MALSCHMMKQHLFFHMLKFQHFCDSINQLDKIDKNYEYSGKTRCLSDMLNDTCAKFYNPFEHMSADNVI